MSPNAPDPPSPDSRLHYNLVTYPNLSDRTSDMYGTGVFISWIIVAYSATIHMIWIDTPGTDSISLDMLATLAYSAIVAGRLIVQVSQFPGSRQEIWSTTDARLVPYSASIVASATACEVSLALTCVWVLLIWVIQAAKEVRQTKRLVVVGILSLWIVVALCVAPPDLEGFAIWICAFVIVLVTPIVLYLLTQLVFIAVKGFGILGEVVMDKVQSADRFTWADSYLVLGVVLLVGCLAVVGYFGGLLFNAWRLFLPESGHSLQDLGQAFALCMGIVNAGYALQRLFKSTGLGFREFFKEVFVA